MRNTLSIGLLVCGLNALALTSMPDPALRAWAEANYPGCIVGEYIDETHPGVQNEFMIDISNVGAVTDLWGTEAFVNVTQMNVSNNPITNWYGPPALEVLYAMNCGLSGTYIVPPYLRTINVSYNAITTLDLSLVAGLMAVRAHHNQISSILWPATEWLFEIDLSHNQLTTLGDGLYAPFASWIDISHNQLTELEIVGGTAATLNASWNQITDVSAMIMADHSSADLSHNQIEHVPTLGNASMVDLSFNPLTQGIDETSYAMHTLRVDNTQLPCLPYLHNNLVNLYCGDSPIDCLPNQPVGLVMDQGRFGFEPVVCGPSSDCYKPLPTLDLKVFLQGPFDPATNTMHDDLRAQGLIPISDPYPGLGFTYSGEGWPDQFDPDVLGVTGPEAIVDWVVVDMFRNTSYYGSTDAERYSRPALLRRDGQVVALDGSLPLVLNTPWGQYKTAIRHRNHLGTISQFGNGFQGETVHIDFTSFLATACYPSAMHGDSLTANERQLWAGDVNFNHKVTYTGANNDRDPILQAVGNGTPNQVLEGVYHAADVNMDGQVKYTGQNNDRDPILENIGGDVPTNIRHQIGFQ